MKRQLVKMVLCGLCGLSAGCFAQTVTGAVQTAPRVAAPPLAPPSPGGTVTGHVYCADTQRPARFANVQLLRQADPPSGGQNTNRGPMYQSVGNARTALDGTFAITSVPAGDYYVAATMTGYISPMAVARMTQNPISGVPSTHVEAGRTADVVISITRGAVVTGRVTYDDGSPVPGVTVRLRPVASTSVTAGGTMGGFGQLGGGFGGDLGAAQTDDRGIFSPGGAAGRQLQRRHHCRDGNRRTWPGESRKFSRTHADAYGLRTGGDA